MTGDGGSASIHVLASAAVVLVAGMIGALIGSAVIDRHRAAAAADLGALAAAAAAGVSVPGPLSPAPAPARAESACATAARVVRANGARLAGCELAGADAVVVAEVDMATWARKWGAARMTARATARAGPVRGDPG